MSTPEIVTESVTKYRLYAEDQNFTEHFMEDSTTQVGFPNSTADAPLANNPFVMSWYLELVYLTLFSAMVLVATGGNIIVIWIVLANKRMRTVTNFFLVNLAVADALISIFNTAFNMISMVHNHWPFEFHYCKFSLFIAPCTITASVVTFVAIAVDRYMAIVHPLKPRMGARFVLAVIAVIWVASGLVAFPNLLYGVTLTWTHGDGSNSTICYLVWPDGVNETMALVYDIFLMAVHYFVPLLILACTYTLVGCSLWWGQAIGERSSRQEETIRSKRRVVKMMIVIVVIFALCWLPYHVYFILTNLFKDIPHYPYINHIYLIIYWLAMSNSMYNPIIYCWMNARFRKGFKYVFRWLPCVTWKASDSASLGRGPPRSTHMSMSEGTKYTFTQKNGEHVLVDTDDSSYNTLQLRNMMGKHGRANNSPRL